MTDLQALADSSRLTAVPEGVTQITSSVRLRPGATVRGAGRGLSIVQVMTPGIDAFIIDGGGADAVPTWNTIEDLTIRTYQPGVTGIHHVAAGACVYRNLVMQGPEITLNIDRNFQDSIDTIQVEPFEGRLSGKLLVHSSDETRYSQYLTVRNYHEREQAADTTVVLCRATNVSFQQLMIHNPGTGGVLITDDCQGVRFTDSFIVKPTYGAILSARNGHTPSFINLTGLSIDQAQAIGVIIFAGTDITISDGPITNGGQGIVFWGYPDVERLRISTSLAEHVNNAIVAQPGARYFNVQGCSIGGSGGAAVVVSPGGSRDFTVSANDFSQGNAAAFADLSGASVQPSRGTVVAGNR